MPYLRFAFSFRGVLSRIEFLCIIVFNYFISIIAFGVVGVFFNAFSSDEQFEFGMISFATIIMFVFLSSPAIRRLKDIGAKGLWILGLAVPYLNFIVLFSLLFRPAWNREKGMRHLFAMLKIFAESDGRINQKEGEFFYRFCTENIPDDKLVLLTVDNFIRGASNPFIGFDHHLKKYLIKGQPTLQDKMFIMGLAVRLAEADGEITPNENLLLEKLHNAFGLAGELPKGFDDLIGMLAKLAKADGVVDKSEIEIVQNWFTYALELSSTQQKKAIEIFKVSKNSSISFDQYARNFFEQHKENIPLLENVMGLLRELAFADNTISKEEADMINCAAVIFGFEKREDNFGKGPEDFVFNNFQEEELAFARILGVSLNAGIDEIKSRYRTLIAANHPDKVASMSDAIKNAAEIETKKINRAYEYFKTQHA